MSLEHENMFWICAYLLQDSCWYAHCFQNAGILRFREIQDERDNASLHHIERNVKSWFDDKNFGQCCKCGSCSEQPPLRSISSPELHLSLPISSTPPTLTLWREDFPGKVAIRENIHPSWLEKMIKQNILKIFVNFKFPKQNFYWSNPLDKSIWHISSFWDVFWPELGWSDSPFRLIFCKDKCSTGSNNHLRSKDLLRS